MVLEGKPAENWQYQIVIYALVLVVITPIVFSLLVPTRDVSEWEEEVRDIESTYYLQSGVTAGNDINIWPLTGIYTPYSGSEYGYTEDGWLYGNVVTSAEHVSQYTTAGKMSGEDFSIVRNPNNGLYYYTKAPDNRNDITPATDTGNGVYNFDGATIYSAVTMDTAHKSDIFFTTTSKHEEGQHYYYEYGQNNGVAWRYAFQPLSNYATTLDGTTYEVNASTSSLSLIWYSYATIDGIGGQLTISGGDRGVSYLTANDIIRAYDNANYTARFDMTFNNFKMHLLITINPTAVTQGLDIATCWNQGFWSVMVYSDQDLASAAANATYEFSADNIWNTVIDLFTFRIAEDYDIDGWLGILASVMFSLPLYAAIIAIGCSQPLLFIVAGVIALIQWIMSLSIGFSWPF